MVKLKKPVGLFLCGGSALGSWQSGVLSGLAAAGVEFDVVAGFSIGSINGAAYCYDKTADLKRMWEAVKPERVLKFRPDYHNIPLELYRHHGNDVFSKLGFVLQNNIAKTTFFSNKPLYDILNGWLSKAGPSFARNIKFYVISHCVETKLPYISVFDGRAQNQQISFVDSLVASCSIPMVFPPVEITEFGRRYHLVDGGVIGIATINLNIFEGCGTVVIISNSRREDLEYSSENPFDYFESKSRKMLAVHTNKIYESGVFIKSAPDIHVIAPPADLGLRFLEFEGVKCSRAFKIGEEEAGRWLADPGPAGKK